MNELEQRIFYSIERDRVVPKCVIGDKGHLFVINRFITAGTDRAIDGFLFYGSREVRYNWFRIQGELEDAVITTEDENFKLCDIETFPMESIPDDTFAEAQEQKWELHREVMSNAIQDKEYTQEITDLFESYRSKAS